MLNFKSYLLEKEDPYTKGMHPFVKHMAKAEFKMSGHPSEMDNPKDHIIYNKEFQKMRTPHDVHNYYQHEDKPIYRHAMNHAEKYKAPANESVENPKVKYDYYKAIKKYTHPGKSSSSKGGDGGGGGGNGGDGV